MILHYSQRYLSWYVQSAAWQEALKNKKNANGSYLTLSLPKNLCCWCSLFKEEFRSGIQPSPNVHFVQLWFSGACTRSHNSSKSSYDVLPAHTKHVIKGSVIWCHKGSERVNVSVTSGSTILYTFTVRIRQIYSSVTVSMGTLLLLLLLLLMLLLLSSLLLLLLLLLLKCIPL